MANLNKVFLIGNLTRDPELRYTNTGLAIAQFGLAINRKWKSPDGEQREETCFVDITAMGRRAEVVSEYLSKGRPVFIEGRLQFRQWEGQDGQRRSKLSVVMDSFEFLDYGSRRTESGGAARPAPGPAPTEPAPAPEKDVPPDVPDDEIPF